MPTALGKIDSLADPGHIQNKYYGNNNYAKVVYSITYFNATLSSTQEDALFMTLLINFFRELFHSVLLIVAGLCLTALQRD